MASIRIAVNEPDKAEMKARAEVEGMMKTLGISFFLEPARENVPDFYKLASGPLGRRILCEIAYETIYFPAQYYGNSRYKQELIQAGIKAFQLFSEISETFEEEYKKASERKPGFGEIRQPIDMLIEAFQKTMEEKRIGSGRNSLGIVGREVLVSLAEKRWVDCDIAGKMFLEFGKRHGIDLVAGICTASSKGHYTVALRQNGRITAHIEPGGLVSIGPCKEELKYLKEEHTELQETIEWKGGFQRTILGGKKRDLNENEVKNYLEHTRNRLKQVEERIKEDEAFLDHPEFMYLGEKRIEKWKKDIEEGIGKFTSFRYSNDEVDENYIEFLERRDDVGELVVFDKQVLEGVTESLKRNWELDKNLESFNQYFSSLWHLISGPALGPDREYELFMLYFEGIEIFGKEKVEDDEFILMLSNRNPIDYAKAVRDAKKRGWKVD